MASVYATLMASSAVTALVGAKVYQEVAPQDTAAPYITLSSGGGHTNPYLGDLPGIDNPIIMFDIWARTAADREAIYQAVIDAMDPVGNMLSQPMSGWEFETKLYRLSFEYSLWIVRST